MVEQSAANDGREGDAGASDWIGLRALITLEYLLLAVAGLLLLAMMVLITGNAVGRYLFNEPIPGVLTATELYLLVGIVFLGLPYLQRKEGNIAVDIISKDFSDTRTALIKVVVRAIVLVLFLLILYEAALMTLDRLEQRATRTGLVPWPTYVSWGLFTSGLAVFCLRLIVQIYGGLADLGAVAAGVRLARQLRDRVGRLVGRRP